MAQQTVPAEFVLCKQCGRVIDSNAEADSLFAQVPVSEVISPQHLTDEGTYSADRHKGQLEPQGRSRSASRIKAAIWDRARRLRDAAS
jgi:hypothetical protein